MSDRFKTILEQMDPEGFDFLECDIRLKNGERGPRHWLCDAVRVLDALDETISKFQFFHGQVNPKLYAFTPPYSIHFRREVVGSALSFRLKYSISDVFVADALRETCRAAGLKGIQFIAATNE